jgi:hypothetical protein
VSQNSRIPNSERGRERPTGACKYLENKKFALPEEDISTLIFVQFIAACISTVKKNYSSYVAVPFLRKITKM